MAAIELHSDDEIDLIEKAKSLIEKTSWMTPVSDILKEASTHFGRNIERELLELDDNKSLTLLQLRKRDKAVVMNVEHYQQLFEINKTLETLLKKQRMDKLDEAGREFDTMYRKLTGKNASNATSHLLNVSENDLAETFEPGGTEVP